MEVRGLTPAVPGCRPYLPSLRGSIVPCVGRCGLRRPLWLASAGVACVGRCGLRRPVWLASAAVACVGRCGLRRLMCRASAAVACVGCCCMRRLLLHASASWVRRLNLRVEAGSVARLRHVRQIAGFGPGHLYSLFAFRPLIESGAAIFHAQAHFPTKPA
jgi:hypothetical protein